MRDTATANVTRGSIAWTNPFRLKLNFFPPKEAAAPATTQTAPQSYAMDRDRIFDYVKKHRLPGERSRQIRRDTRNQVDFIADVRDLQTRPDVEPR